MIIEIYNNDLNTKKFNSINYLQCRNYSLAVVKINRPISKQLVKSLKKIKIIKKKLQELTDASFKIASNIHIHNF